MEPKKEKLRSLSFQDADIQALVEARMAADESLTLAAATRGVFRELISQTEHLQTQLLAENANTVDLNNVIARMENDAVVSKETIAALEEERSKLGQKMDLVMQQRDAYKATSLFEGLPEEAVQYMQTFFDELVGERHYISPQMFVLDLLRRVQEGTKFFIPNNKQTVKKEWIHQEEKGR